MAQSARLPRRASYTYCPDDIQVQIVFYSTFEPIVLPGGGPMEAMGVQKLYKPSPTPILYVGLVADVLGRVPFRVGRGATGAQTCASRLAPPTETRAPRPAPPCAPQSLLPSSSRPGRPGRVPG